MIDSADSLSVMLELFIIVSSVSSVCLFVFLAFLHIKCHNSFHPLFSNLFLCSMFSYTVDSVCIAIFGLSDLCFDTSSDSLIVTRYVERVAYYYVSPLLLALLLERMAATILVASYEYSVNATPYLVIIHGLTVVCVALLCYFEMELDNLVKNLWGYFLTTIYLCMYTILIMLLTINRKNIRAMQTEKVTLTLRYQLAENVKTIRMLLTFLLVDTAITVVDMLGTVVYDTGDTVDSERLDDATYAWIFMSVNIASFSLANILPILLLCQTNAYRVQLRKLLRAHRKPSAGTIYGNLKVKVHSTAPYPTKQSTKLRNVLGVEIVMQQDTERYFETLKQMWN